MFLLAVVAKHPRNLFFGPVVDDLLRGDGGGGPHAHVQGSVVVETEAALGEIEVHGGDAEVEEDAVDGGNVEVEQSLAQVAEVGGDGVDDGGGGGGGVGVGGAAGVLGGSLEARPRDGVREGVDVEADEGAHLGVRADDRAGVTARAHRAVDVVSQRAALEALEHLTHEHGHVRGAVRVLLEGVRAAGSAGEASPDAAPDAARRERARYTAAAARDGGDSSRGAGGAARVAGQGESPRAVIALAAEVIAVRLVVRTDASRAPCGARAVGYGVRRPPNADDDARRLWSCSFRSQVASAPAPNSRRATVAVGTARSGGGRRPSRVRVAMDAAGRMGRSTRKSGRMCRLKRRAMVALAMCALLAFVFATRQASVDARARRRRASSELGRVVATPLVERLGALADPSDDSSRVRDEPRRAPSATIATVLGGSDDHDAASPTRISASSSASSSTSSSASSSSSSVDPAARALAEAVGSLSLPPARSSPSPSPTRTFARSR